MRRHSPSPSFASARPNSNIFSPLVKAAGWLLLLGHISKVTIWNRPISRTVTTKCVPSTLHVCQRWCQDRGERGKKAALSFGPLRTGTSGIPVPAHHGPIFLLRPPTCTLLHSPPNVKPSQLLLGLRTNISHGRDINGINWDIARWVASLPHKTAAE